MPTPLEALGATPNASQALPRLVTGGQPQEADFRALKEAGVEAVLDIRDPMEPRPCDEAKLVPELGMRYYNVPVVAGRLDDQVMDAALDVLRKEREASTLFHCNSGNRCGGPLIAYLMLEEGMTEEDAVMSAMRAGMRSAEIMEWGTDYARRRSG